ncbi:MAG: hypothetical protein EOM24_02645 [Chloroflexia bacterium]|nr:hypothetical protein [Chloroflexia bacterium]
MSSSYSPRSPKVLKGAFAVYKPGEEDQDPTWVPFQYNPNQVRRQLAHRTPRNEGAQGGANRENTPQDMRRVVGPPVETINMAIELSAADALENPDDNTLVSENGLVPALAALELLMYAPSFQFEQNEQFSAEGVVNLEPALLPLTLLVLGASRVVPIQLTSFSVTEESFDKNLNPIRVKVDVGMQVLSYLDVIEGNNQKAIDIFVAYQKRKERLARDHLAQVEVGQRTKDLLPE